ncbi:MAG TPA: hypothetical protein VHB69_07870 [Mycobacteriales bacterium]|nr:hypothetical protein [Mycobacteriales bacterium]
MVVRLDDKYLPGAETAEGAEVRLAAGIAEWLRSPRPLRGFRRPMLLALGMVVGIVTVAMLTHAL